MATGNYGTVRLADVSPADTEIIMNYTPSRDLTNDFVLKKLNAAELLQPYFSNPAIGGQTNEILGGLYNLKLPAAEFNNVGIYNILIRPAQIRTQIYDCGVLQSLPNIKGIIIDLTTVPQEFLNRFVTQGLVGYRVEYLNNDGTKNTNFFRIITSSFFCEAVVANTNNTSDKAQRWIYTDAETNLLFCTVSPSSSPSNKPNATPYIGSAGQNIIITNTFFDPVMIEVEIVEQDISTLAIALYGNQTKSIEDGIYTIYDSNNNIYKQYNLYEIRSQFNELLYEVRQDRGSNIDTTKNFDNITA